MRKLILPKQHGAWVMVILPFLIGVIVGHPKWIHLPLFVGWLLLYIASYPLMTSIKTKRKRKMYIKWFTAYVGIAFLFLILPFILHRELLWFAVFLIPMLAVNSFYAKRKKERAFLNDLFAIMGLCLGGPAAYVIGTGLWDQTALYIWIASVIFFNGSVFFVKMFIREKNNPTFKWYSWVYHCLIILVSFVLGFVTLGVAYLFSFFRAFAFYRQPLKPKQTAVIEFTNSIYFLFIMIVWLI